MNAGRFFGIAAFFKRGGPGATVERKAMRIQMRISYLVVILMLLLASGLAQANVTLPDVIGTGMVLQRDRTIPIWGKADPGEVITVRFARKIEKNHRRWGREVAHQSWSAAGECDSTDDDYRRQEHDWVARHSGG